MSQMNFLDAMSDPEGRSGWTLLNLKMPGRRRLLMLRGKSGPRTDRKRRGPMKSLVVVACALAGCQTYDDRPLWDPLNLQVEMQPRAEKTVQVTPSETAFSLQFANGASEVQAAEHRAAVSFLRRRAQLPSDEVFVEFGVGAGEGTLAQARRQAVAVIVTEAGIDPARVGVREAVAGVAPDEVNLSVRRYLVTLPGCPDFTTRAGRTFDNRPYANWGCATATNLGLMVAEPRDILQGRGGTPGDGEALVLGIQRYRAGMTRELEVDDTNTAESHGVTGESGSGGGGAGGSNGGGGQ